MQIHKQAELDRDNGGGVVARQAVYDWALISRQGRPLLHSLLNKSSATLWTLTLPKVDNVVHW